ncbi:hypothetical protein C5E08_15575 [Rathayibacter iranicus]|uniref:Uncharacterized protein n=2 Tax=Rathayibacter iranicus TaxID=59737 RepID=A0AAD1AI48_9MICO|nr:hypothetical protein [Rathayibacter iranicus]PWJ66895.1 hypothetical protein B0H03_101351 [Rathayibacter iranicus NCPPB 2253 = VKM Ac-1602]AZZ57174.1 hypothetical protein C7V51_15820 [Rathayibacter iranicus]PPI41199.1 hypothetical protein C5E09_14685 [Rathayibacter iranicus]PPI57445.1 hypothetical protein C5E08_15575 [Rathayibacter iranicus]PPI68310.1 hypothetical protein C5E01_14625 [Rathayibacter iranicus]
MLAEADRLLARLERATRDGREEFLRPVSDSRDIGALALINLADFVHRDLPEVSSRDSPPHRSRDFERHGTLRRTTMQPSTTTGCWRPSPCTPPLC